MEIVLYAESTVRGIITDPGIVLLKPDGMRQAPVDPVELRSWLLYWDKIAAPENRHIFFELDDVFQFLAKAGVVDRPPVNPPGGNAASIFLASRMLVFAELEKVSPGSWAITSPQGSWDGPQDDRFRALRVHLMKALPVPDQDVPLDEILTFRDRRRSERDALMGYVDDLYQSVRDAPDRPLAEHTAIEKIARGARDQLDAVQEARFRFRLIDLAADFNLVGAGAAAMGSLALGFEFPAVVGNTVLAGAGVTIRNIIGIVNPKKANTPFRYVISYHDEVFRPE